MVVWLAATPLFVLSITFMPVVQACLSTMGLILGKWGTVLFDAILGTCWIEVAKRVRLAACDCTRLVLTPILPHVATYRHHARHAS